MNLFPAIDLIEGCAVRLVKGDYAQKTVYSTDPVGVASSFHEAGAEFLHVVDLEGARDGHTPNIDTVRRLAETSGLKVEIGGGIRSEETVKKYLDIGVMRVILGTAALTDSRFLEDMVQKYGEKIAVGVDIKAADCFETAKLFGALFREKILHLADITFQRIYSQGNPGRDRCCLLYTSRCV